MTPILQVAVAATADGDNEIVAAPGAGKKIQVISYSLFSTSATQALHLLKSGAGTTKATLAMLQTAPAFRDGSRGEPVLECATNQALNVNNPAGVDTYGHLTYQIVAA